MRNRKASLIGIAGLSLVGLGYGLRAFASGVPSTNALSYAGVLEDGTGPVTGNHNIQLFLYDAVTAGNILCQTTTAPIGVIDGHFSVLLPDACTTAVGANPNTWVDVLVDGSDTGRTMIGAVPYAIEANHAVNATNAATATSATNATTAATAQAAGGALETSITQMQSAISALQAKPAPLTTISLQCLNATDPSTDSWQLFATQCIAASASSESTVIDACVVAASRKCVGLGYSTGWLSGEEGTGCIQIACIK